MSKFTTRVELHDADSDDYDNLHAEMKKKGFTRTISSGGKTYRLPTAEYNYEGNATGEQVRDKADSAASNVKDKYEILVTESSGRYWKYLKQI